VKRYITTISKKEGVKLIPEGLEAVFEASQGDMRKATNLLQAAAATQGEVDDIAIYSVLGKVSPQRVREMINLGIKGEFLEAREILRSLLIDEGLGAEDVLRMIYSELMRMQMPEKWKVRISDTVGEVDFRLTQGARPEIQLSTLIAKLALASEEIER
jgi:replication factor C small subunit